MSEDEGHAQPMTAHFEGAHGPLWFYAYKHGRLVHTAASSHPAVFHYIGPEHDLYACVHGEVALSEDDAAVGQFCSDEVARWYPQGQHDPNLALLRFTPSSAQIWLSTGGARPQLFGFDQPRAAAQDIHAEVRF